MHGFGSFLLEQALCVLLTFPPMLRQPLWISTLLLVYALSPMPVSAVLVTYTNPVLAASNCTPACSDDDARGCEFPDPGVAQQADGSWLAATTTIDSSDVFALHRSTDLVNWSQAGFVWPNGDTRKPSWCEGQWFAPELHFVHGSWWLLFSARHSVSGRQAVGIAVSASGLATGPFQSLDAPLLADDSNDPTLAQEDNDIWLVWKQKRPDRIFARKVTLSRDNQGNPNASLTGETELWLSVTESWEHNVVEAPWLLRRGAWWYLFYAGDYNKNVVPPDHKALGCARSSTLSRAEWQKCPSALLHSRSGGLAPFLSPGHCSVVGFKGAFAEEWFVLYHASRNLTNGTAGPREMMLDKLLFDEDGWPRMATADNSPSDAPVPMPQLNIEEPLIV